MKASNDNLLVYIPSIKEDVLSDLDLDPRLLEERAREKTKNEPVEIHSVGATVQDKTFVPGEFAVLNGPAIRLEGVQSGREGWDLAMVKAYVVCAHGPQQVKKSKLSIV